MASKPDTWSLGRPSPALPPLLPVLACLAFAGCADPGEGVGGSNGPAEVPIPPEMSGGTLLGLGPHEFRATLRTEDPLQPRRNLDTELEVTWIDLSRHRSVRQEGGTQIRGSTRSGTMQWSWEGREWVLRAPSGGGTQPLQESVALWGEALGPARHQLGFRKEELEDFRGRQCRRYVLSLAPLPAAAGSLETPQAMALRTGRSTTVSSITGALCADEQTGNRLWAEATISIALEGSDEPVVISYQEERTRIGETLELPTPSSWREPTTPQARGGALPPLPRSPFVR